MPPNRQLEKSFFLLVSLFGLAVPGPAQAQELAGDRPRVFFDCRGPR